MKGDSVPTGRIYFLFKGPSLSNVKMFNVRMAEDVLPLRLPPDFPQIQRHLPPALKIQPFLNHFSPPASRGSLADRKIRNFV